MPNKEDEIIVIPVSGEPQSAITMLYAVHNAVTDHDRQSESRTMAVNMIECAISLLREAEKEESDEQLNDMGNHRI